MSRFADARATWDDRYAGESYHFGTAPNRFVAAQAHRLAPGSQVLCVADGEGRNSVWLAGQGHAVTAFDVSPRAVAKAARLAADRGVTVAFHEADITDWPWRRQRYDAVVAIFIQFLPPEERDAVFAGMRDAVRPGGLVLVQGYRPEQVDLGTGGPPRREHMYTEAWLRTQFAGWEVLEQASRDEEIAEGVGHRGLSALIEVVARRPAG